MNNAVIFTIFKNTYSKNFTEICLVTQYHHDDLKKEAFIKLRNLINKRSHYIT